VSHPLSVAAALGSACCFGLASAGQFAAVRAAPDRSNLDARLLLDLARQRLWWLAAAAEVLAVLLQYSALRGTSVAVVQALLVLGLPVAVVVSTGLRLPGRSLLGLALTTAGVGVFAALQPTAEPGPVSTRSLVAPVLVAVVVAALAQRTPPVLTGLAAGIATGCGGVLLAATAAQPLDRVLLRPPLYAAAAVGLLALQVAQSAMRAPEVGPPLAALTLAEPAVAVALSALALHQRPALPLAAVAAAILAALGVVLLELATPRATAAAP
jgi:drug/metabolite transporter (DMT)-like permease